MAIIKFEMMFSANYKLHKKVKLQLKYLKKWKKVLVKQKLAQVLTYKSQKDFKETYWK